MKSSIDLFYQEDVTTTTDLTARRRREPRKPDNQPVVVALTLDQSSLPGDDVTPLRLEAPDYRNVCLIFAAQLAERRTTILSVEGEKREQ